MSTKTSKSSEAASTQERVEPTTEKNITFRALKFAHEVAYYTDLLLGLPKEIWGDRVKYELRNEMQTAWQQWYGNVDSAYSSKGKIMPTEEPKIFSAAQQVLYHEDRVQAALDKAGGMQDESEEVDDAQMDLELAKHRLNIRNEKFMALFDVWGHFVGHTGDSRWVYKAFAERKGNTKRTMSNDDLRKQLDDRRSTLENIHLPESEIADTDGETA